MVSDPSGSDPVARLRWQCRRGMRELDFLLTGYLDERYAHASSRRKQAFRDLLSLPDPDLIRYLLGGQAPPDAQLADVVQDIRGDPETGSAP